MTQDELNTISNAITNAIKKGFDSSNLHAFDDQGNAMSPGTTKDEWERFIRAAHAQQATDNKNIREDEIQRKIDALQHSNNANSKLGRKKLDELRNELERSQNGGISDKDAKDYKKQQALNTFNKWKNVATAIMQIAQNIQQVILTVQRSNLALNKNYFAYQQSVAKANLALMTKQTQSVITTMTSLTSGMATEAGFSIYKVSGAEALGGVEKTMAETSAAQELQAAEIKRKADKIKGVTGGIGSAMAAVGVGIAAVAGWTGVGAIIGGAIALIGGIVGGVGQMVAADMEVDYEQIKQVSEQFQQEMQLAINSVENLKNVVDGFDSTVQKLTQHIIGNDDLYKKIGLTFGFMGEEYASYARKMSAEVTRYFNITAQEQSMMTSSYASESSRAKLLSASEMEKVYATGKVFGIGTQEAASLYGAMNIFNLSINSGEKSLTKMYKSITRMGLSASKFSKDLKENMKLAEKYNFKSSVENMMKLTQWAQQTRFNLNSATSFADTIINGNLGDILEKSAKLQVLGGSAAIYSDPLGMLYDAGANVGDLAQRMAGMFNDITGKFNKKTGETEFSWYENRMIAARAQALGMDMGEVKNMLRQSSKQADINQRLGNLGGLKASDKTAIGNNATWNAEKRNWEVSVLQNGERGTMSITDFAKLDAETRNKILLPKNEEESIVDIAANTRSIKEIMEARTTHLMNEKEPELYSSVASYADKALTAQETIYHMSSFVSEAKKSLTAIGDNMITQANETRNFFNANSKLIETYRKSVVEGIRRTKEISDLTVATVNMLAQRHGYDKLTSAVEKSASTYASTSDVEERDANMTNLYSSSNTSERNLYRALHNGYDASGRHSFENEANSVHDATGNTNGAVISRASNVQPINDGAVNVKTAKRDQYLVAQTGGPIDILLKQLLPGLQALLLNNNSNSGLNNNSLNVNLSGNLTLSDNGSKINLVDIIRNEPMVANKFVSLLLRSIETSNNGKSVYNYKV